MKTICFLCFVFLSLSAFSQNKIIPVVVDGDEVTYSKENEQVIAKGHVVMKYKGVTLKCDEASYSVKLNAAYIKGNVEIINDKGTVRAEEANYDFANKKAQINNIHIESFPMYGGAESGEKVSDNEYVLNRGYVTTCNLKKPHYKLASKRIIIYPGKKVVAKNVVLKIGDIPIFYIPYYSQSLKDNSFPVELSPGKDSDWGFYVLSRWRYYFNDNNKGKVNFDWYDKRGIGTGVSHEFNAGKYGKGIAKIYYINDDLYGNNTSYIPDDRYKSEFSYHNTLGSSLTLNAEYHKFSDVDFMKDFFYREYEKDTHPLSYFLADYSLGNSAVSLLAQKRVNKFYEETEYLPKLEYNLYRHSINNSPFYFESTESIAGLTKKYADSGLDYDSTRFHTHNVLSYERKIAWLHIVPYTGMYSTFYSRDIYGGRNVWRQAPEAGISFSTKLYRAIRHPFTLFGEKIDAIRHIITPKLSYSYIHPPTTSRNELAEFDDVDTLERTESIILEMKNKIQAKNGDKVWDLFYFNPSLEYKLNQEGKGSFLDNLKTDLEFFPKKGISITSDSEYDFVDRAFKEVNIDFGIKAEDNKKYSVYIGERYAKDSDSQTTLSFMYQLNSKWQFRTYWRYGYEGGSGFQEQQYVVRRDLHCWLMDLGLDIDQDSNYTLWVIFRIKAFPKIHVGFDHTYHGARSGY